MIPTEPVTLLPCPFCGGNDLAFTRPCTDGGLGVLCRACHTTMDSRVDDEAAAIAAWNTRAKSEDTHRAADGLVVVPREPTREMWAAGANAVLGYKQRHHDKVVEQVWSAMIAATQQPAGEGESLRREIERLEAELAEAWTVDKGFYDWMVERGLMPDGDEFEWADIVVALTEQEIELERAALSATQQPVSEGAGRRSDGSTSASRQAEVDEVLEIASRQAARMGAVIVPDPERISAFVNGPDAPLGGDEAKVEPVAWLLNHPRYGDECELAFPGREPITSADRAAGWSTTALYAAPVLPVEVMEKIARIIDPSDWSVVDSARASGQPAIAERWAAPSLAKSDAILSTIKGDA